MESLKQAVENSLKLYAETSGMTLQEIGRRFQESDECRKNILTLVALQASGGAH